jgi:hypothetical protein
MSLAVHRPFALLPAFLILSSCSSGPSAPEKGTPAFYWQAAKEAYSAGDYLKTLEHLDHLTSSDDYAARALPWSLVLTSGMAAGYMELGDDYTIGGRANKADPSKYRGLASRYRDFANRLALQYADGYLKAAKLKDGPVPLAFPFPKGSPAQAPALTKVGSGILITPEEIEATEKRTVDRGIVLAACRAAGAPDDTARSEGIFKGQDASVPRATFQMAMAETLYTESQLYTRDKLDTPDKLEILCQRAQDALKTVPESKESKALATKIDTALKKAKK